MRRFALLLLILLFVPAAAAGPGHSGGVASATQNVPFFVTLEGTNVTGGQILVPTDYPAELLAVTALNRGTRPILVDLFLEEDVQVTWTVPADGMTHAFRHYLGEAGNVSMDFRSPTADPEGTQTIDVLVDWSGSCAYHAVTCIWKLLAWEIPGANLVIPITTTEAGTYEVHIPEPRAHLIEAQLWTHDGAMAISEPVVGRGGGTVVLQWLAQANTTYAVWVESANLVEDPRTTPRTDPSVTARVTVVADGPIKTTPAMPLLAALGVLTLLRRRLR